MIPKSSSSIYSDNTAATTVLSNPVNNERIRHIATKYKYGIALSQFGVLSYEEVHTSENPADIGTKVLPPCKFIPLRTRILGGVFPHNHGNKKKTITTDEFV